MLDLIPTRKSSASARESEQGGNDAPAFKGNSLASRLAGRWLVVLFCLVVWAGILFAIMMR